MPDRVLRFCAFALVLARGAFSIPGAEESKPQRIVVGRDVATNRLDLQEAGESTHVWRLGKFNKTDSIDSAFKYGRFVVAFGWSGCCAGITTIIDAVTGVEKLEFLNYSPQLTERGVLVFRRWYPHFIDPAILSDSVAALDLNLGIPLDVPKKEFDNPSDSIGSVLYPSGSQAKERHVILPELVVTDAGRLLFFIDQPPNSQKLCFVRLSIAKLDEVNEKHNCILASTLLEGDSTNFRVSKFFSDPFGYLTLNLNSGEGEKKTSFSVDRDTLQVEPLAPAMSSEHAFAIPWHVQRNAVTEFTPIAMEGKALTAYRDVSVKVKLVVSREGNVRGLELAGIKGPASDIIKASILRWKFKPAILDGRPTEAVTEFVSKVRRLDDIP